MSLEEIATLEEDCVSVHCGNVQLPGEFHLYLLDDYRIMLGDRPIAQTTKEKAREDYQRIKSSLEHGKYRITLDEYLRVNIELTD